VSKEEAAAPNITRDFLRPIRLTAAHNSHPIGIEWGEHAQTIGADQYVVFGSTPVALYLVDLGIAAVDTDGSIDIHISADTLSATYRLTISSSLPAGYAHTKIAGLEVQFKKSNGVVVPLPEHLVVDPLIVRYADGTYSYNCYHIPANLDAGKFPVARLESLVVEGHSAKSRVDGQDQGKRYHSVRGLPATACRVRSGVQ
jgi:hypothetical protein